MTDEIDQDAGSAYVFSRDHGGADNWGEVIKLTASDAAAFDAFGTSVAISGDTVVVGAPDDVIGSNTSQGSAYVFSRNHGGADSWGEVAKLTASDGAANDRFGQAVAASGDTAVVGALCNADAGTCTGSAYVFARNQGGADAWGEVVKLVSSDADFYDRFGEAVAIAGDLVVIGAPYNSDAGSSSGSAYIFARNQGGADAWGEVIKLTALNAASYDFFGCSVAVEGDLVAVGAFQAGTNNEGTVYFFERNQGGADSWGLVTQISPADGSTGDQFGNSISLINDMIVVGAKYHDGAGSDSGAAYVLDRNLGGQDAWGQVAKLTAADATAGDEFGFSVVSTGARAMVGAPGADGYLGAVYVFDRNLGGADAWGEAAKLAAPDAPSTGDFGRSVSVAAETLFMGAQSDSDAGFAAGSAYIFDHGCGGLDFGDAPDPSYPTLLASDGARHVLGGTLVLGASVDAEADGQPSPDATGDDIDPEGDDEDGVAFTSGLGVGLDASLDVTATAAGLLNAWVDFNADGDWLDAGEQVFTDQAVAAGVNPLSFAVPAGATLGFTHARFRLDSAGGLLPSGLALDGEVEDEQVEIMIGADLAVTMSDAPDPVPAGRPLTYTVTVTNNGPMDASSVTLTDILTPELVFVSSTPGSPDCVFATDTLVCDLGTLAATTSTQVMINVVVDYPVYGSVSNTVGVTAAENDPIPTNDTASESTTIGLFSDGFENSDTAAWSSTVP